ncbi:abortive infection family protein [Aestuariibaculum suncheonense]|uniref:Abortive infection family protein n=1 Tax=Aestuariibaculum suncheonense TaxID=1028745 RepID=A0A8J6QSR8_9FLAO|nr:abortive infection family protein [Aestuariibaculum suncheonense]MBD0835224.1 abortive infection family protein [Aestuariibaculum suncheonense]
MKISNKITKQLGTLIAGDTHSSPYLSGPQLVDFYNECGFDDVYGEGFPSRWKYSTEKIVESNGSDSLRIILENFVDPRRFGGDENLAETIKNEINSLIKYDGFELSKTSGVYKIIDTKGNFIEPESTQKIGHKFISEQIEKCQNKIANEDYNGAITNSRSLTEAILIHIIETLENNEVKNDGNLLKLWGRAKKALQIDLDKSTLPDYVIQVLSGLDSIINGLAGLSNNAGDRHANNFNTKRHHAKLSVNATMSLCDFLIDLLNNKNNLQQ